MKRICLLLWVFGVGTLFSCAKPVEPKIPRDIRARAGRAVLFDASGTDAKKSEYLWDFGDGAKGEGLKASHTYSAAGKYQATLTIKGGGRRGTANIQVTIEPPSPLDTFPKETGAALVVDDIKEAAAIWDLAFRVPSLARQMMYIRKVTEEEIGFFPLDSQALKERGFDPAKGVGLGLGFAALKGSSQFVCSVGTLPDGAALTWVMDWVSGLGLSTRKESYGEATIWEISSDQGPLAALADTGDFLLIAPALDGEGRHLEALRLSLDTSGTLSLGDAPWVQETAAEGGTIFYIEGGEVLQGFLESLVQRDRRLAPLAELFNSVSFALRGLSLGVRAKEGALEFSGTGWLTEEGARRYAALSPAAPWLALEPSLLKSSVGYGFFLLDPMAAATQAAEALTPSDRASAEQILSMIQTFTGIKPGSDLAEPLGPAGAVVLGIAPDGLATAIIGGAPVFPGEVILAYQIEDQDRLSASLAKLASSLSALGMMGGFQIGKRQIGSVDAYSLSFGVGTLGWAAKEGVLILAVGPGQSTMEKALELIEPGKKTSAEGAAAKGAGSLEFVLEVDELRSVLSRTQEKLKALGQSNRDLDEILSAISYFHQMKLVSQLKEEKVEVELLLKLSQP